MHQALHGAEPQLEIKIAIDRDTVFKLTPAIVCRQLEDGMAINGDFDLKLRLCAMQRLMQALGAYGFLGLVKGHKHFLKHVAAAMQSLQREVAEIDGLTELDKTLRQLT